MVFGLFKKKSPDPMVSREECEKKILAATTLSNAAANSDSEGQPDRALLNEAREVSFDAGKSVTLCNEMPEPLKTYWAAHFIARTAFLDSLLGKMEEAANQYYGTAQVLEEQVESNSTACNPIIEEATQQFAAGMYYTAAECFMYAAEVLRILDREDSLQSVYNLYDKAGALAMDTQKYSSYKRLYVVHGVTLGLASLPWDVIDAEVFGLITQHAGTTINMTTASLEWGTTLEEAMAQLPMLAELVDIYALLLRVDSEEAMNSLRARVDTSECPTPWRDAQISAYRLVAERLGVSQIN